MAARFPPATLALIVANVAVYLLQMAGGDALIERFGLWPIGSPHFAYWQLLTYGFLHSPDTLAHIFFNMFALFMFGPELERLMGSRRFTTYYLVSVVAAGIAQTIVTASIDTPYPTVGASGGIFGVLLAFALFFPRVRLAIYGIIPMPAWLFVTLYGILELIFGVTNTQAGVAHFAHLGGMLGGALLLLYWRARHVLRRPL